MPNGIDLDLWAPKSLTEGARAGPVSADPLRLRLDHAAGARASGRSRWWSWSARPRAGCRPTGCACRSSARVPPRAGWCRRWRGQGLQHVVELRGRLTRAAGP